jgi:hypothetical protein
MLRTRYHELTPAQSGRLDPAKYPPLATDGHGAELDPADVWLAHIQAGRIEVR